MENPSQAAASIREIFSPDGTLARGLERFEFRDGQLRMALAAERALREARVLLCEAGTGTGKTLAYLIPAILSGKKVVVSTATRALQEQIVRHDIPMIEQALGLSANAVVMKGLGNYVCLRRYQQARHEVGGLDTPSLRRLALVEDWVQHSVDGDLGELNELPEGDALATRIASSSDTRIGPTCMFHEECFITRMRRNAAAARVVIVNHHLFFADLALRGPHPGQVLPDYDAVIFDEAHHLEDIATNFFSLRVSSNQVETLAREAEKVLQLMQQAQAALAAVSAVRATAQAFFDRLRALHESVDGRVAVVEGAFNGPGARLWHDFDTALEALYAATTLAQGRVELHGVASLADEVEVIGRRSQKMRQDLASIVEVGSDFVAWIENSTRALELSASPIDLAPILRHQLFDAIPGAILTSATLADGSPSRSKDAEPPSGGSGNFRFLRQRLGLDEGQAEPLEEVVPAPFDFAGRSLLYLPTDLPLPDAPDFPQRVADRSEELIAITDGGAFVLTTSLRAMRAVHQALRKKLSGRSVLLQGEAPKHALLERFRAEGNAVLVATMSFWEGVDVPGHALRLVVMDKVPFSAPNDPILKARADKLEREGKSGFRDLYLPLAQRLLKQGFGRLLRHRDDAGIVAVLDPRLTSKGYGKRLLAALPPASRVGDLQEVRAFWGQFANSAV